MIDIASEKEPEKTTLRIDAHPHLRVAKYRLKNT
jgi:hypothetical protein